MKVFKLNEIEWYMAETIDEAIRALEIDTAGAGVIDNPYELSGEEMDTTFFAMADNRKLSFTNYLQGFIKKKDNQPQFFASIENVI